jgi:pimeloyl-ACP methyl ester carboxylesterase
MVLFTLVPLSPEAVSVMILLMKPDSPKAIKIILSESPNSDTEGLPLCDAEPSHTNINIVDLGNKNEPTIIMLHGWGRSVESLRGLGELLATTYRVILVDLPGFGESPLPFEASNEGGGWSTLDYAHAIDNYIDQLGIKSCTLLGHSFGGRISIRLASRNPQKFTSVILVGSHGLQTKRSALFKLKAAAIRFSGRFLKSVDGWFGTRLFERAFIPRFGSIDYQQAGQLRKTLVKTVTEDLTEEAREITQPTLLLWGEEDRQTPLDLAHRFHNLITRSTLFTFPNMGHEPFADVGSHTLCRYIERFLANKESTI